MYKNNKNSIGNYCIYAIFIDFKTFKFGKADLDRTDSTGDPVRLQQQLKLLSGILSFVRVDALILVRLYKVSTKVAKERESQLLQKHYDKTGEIPKGNRNSFNPKKKE